MDFEKYTERSKGFIQSAQTLALRRNHQQLTPLHLLSVLLEDKEGLAANLIRAAGGDPERARQGCDAELGEAAEGRGRRAARSTWRRRRRGCSIRRSRSREKAGDQFVTAERLLLALALATGTPPARVLADAGVTAQALNRAIEEVRKGRAADLADRRGQLRRAEEVRARPDRGGGGGQARSGDRPRRGDPPHHPGAVAADQEQPGADRRGRRRQDRDRRGPGAAHRQGRRAGDAEGQAAAGARPRRAGRRLEVPRRVRGAAEGGAERGHRVARARSSCSSTSCTRWSAPAPPKARWTPPTC